ncbi:MAG: hypothetical protein ACLUEV_10895 [Alistipes sp.]
MKTDFQLRVINIIRELRQGQNASQAYVAELLDLRSSGLVGNIESPRFHKYTLNSSSYARLFSTCSRTCFSTKETLLPYKERIKLLINKIIDYDG